MAWTRTNRVEDLVEIGDEVDVKVIKIDEKGRVDASMKALLPRPPNLNVMKKVRSLIVLTAHVITRTTNLRKNLQKHQKIQNKKRRNVWDGGAKPLIS